MKKKIKLIFLRVLILCLFNLFISCDGMFYKNFKEDFVDATSVVFRFYSEKPEYDEDGNLITDIKFIDKNIFINKSEAQTSDMPISYYNLPKGSDSDFDSWSDEESQIVEWKYVGTSDSIYGFYTEYEAIWGVKYLVNWMYEGTDGTYSSEVENFYGITGTKPNFTLRQPRAGYEPTSFSCDTADEIEYISGTPSMYQVMYNRKNITLTFDDMINASYTTSTGKYGTTVTEIDDPDVSSYPHLTFKNWILENGDAEGLPTTYPVEDTKYIANYNSTKVYLDPQNGDDSKFGYLETKPVKTTTKAKELLFINPEDKELIVLNSMKYDDISQLNEIKNNLGSNSKELTIKRGKNISIFSNLEGSSSNAAQLGGVFDGNSEISACTAPLFNFDSGKISFNSNIKIINVSQTSSPVIKVTGGAQVISIANFEGLSAFNIDDDQAVIEVDGGACNIGSADFGSNTALKVLDGQTNNIYVGGTLKITASVAIDYQDTHNPLILQNYFCIDGTSQASTTGLIKLESGCQIKLNGSTFPNLAAKLTGPAIQEGAQIFVIDGTPGNRNNIRMSYTKFLLDDPELAIDSTGKIVKKTSISINPEELPIFYVDKLTDTTTYTVDATAGGEVELSIKLTQSSIIKRESDGYRYINYTIAGKTGRVQTVQSGTTASAKLIINKINGEDIELSSGILTITLSATSAGIETISGTLSRVIIAPQEIQVMIIK